MYGDTSEFVIPVEVWWRYDYRDTDREPSATERDPKISNVSIGYNSTDLTITFDTMGSVDVIIRDESFKPGKEKNDFDLLKEVFEYEKIDVEACRRFPELLWTRPYDQNERNYVTVGTEYYVRRPNAWVTVTDEVVEANRFTLGDGQNRFSGSDREDALQSVDNYAGTNPDWLMSYVDDPNSYIEITYGATTEKLARHSWIIAPNDIRDSIETIETVESTPYVDPEWNKNYDKTYQLRRSNTGLTPVYRYPYYPEMLPESLYDGGVSPEENIERKIRQEIQKELDKDTTQKYFKGIEKVYAGPLSPTYLESDNTPMICLMFDQSAVIQGQPVSGRNVGFRTANSEDQTLSFTALVYATADREYTDPYVNSRIVDTTLSDLREFMMDKEQFDNVGGALQTIIGPINFPRTAIEVAGELMFVGSFEFYIRYRPN